MEGAAYRPPRTERARRELRYARPMRSAPFPVATLVAILLGAGACTGSVEGGTDASASDGGVAPRDTGARDGGAAQDASGVDGGGASDAGSDGGTTGFDCASAVFCDDFEGASVGGPPASPWTVSASQGAVVVDDTRAMSGSHALHVTTEDGSGSYRRAYAVLSGAPVFPAVSTEMYGRMRLFLVATPTGSVHWTNIQAEGDVSGMSFRSLYRYGGQHDGRIMANYETNGVSNDCWDHSATVMPTDRWACLEWHYRTSTDEMVLSLDGTPLDDVHVVGAGEGCGGHDTGDHWYAPVFDRLSLGWEHYQATSAREMWIDDVAIDDQPIGCD